MKKAFFHGIIASIFTTAAACVYNIIYTDLMFVDFSCAINIGSILGSCFFGCMLASIGYFFSLKIFKGYADVVFNVILLLVTFGLFTTAFYYTLPLEIDSPELFIGLSIPLHMMPALFWLATKPLFYK